MWKCADGRQCVPSDIVCDGEADCKDGSDESNCEVCPENYWPCQEGPKCIPNYRVCDGESYDDCEDESDEHEEFCKHWTCPREFLKCDDGLQCYDEKYVLDGNIDCNDESDEELGKTCAEGFFLCENKAQCIENYWVCDGHSHCNDKSDEEFCDEWQCLSDYWPCADGLQCIMVEDVCDGKTECYDKSDEHNQLCGCAESEWPCQDGDGCIPIGKVCNGHYDCYDKSDESKETCHDWTCLDSMWTCKNSLTCLLTTEVCDGLTQCADLSDESNCTSWMCHADWWKCKNDLHCVPRTDVCDAKADCSDASDEKSEICETYTCPSIHVKCADNKQCISKDNICDTMTDCHDGSNELCTAQCLQYPLVVKSIVRRCQEDNNVCFAMHQFCDGVPDCPYGSDEAASNCKCEDWGMVRCLLVEADLCIFNEWISSTGISNNLCAEHSTVHGGSIREDISLLDISDDCEIMIWMDDSGILQSNNNSLCDSVSCLITQECYSFCLNGRFSNRNEDIALQNTENNVTISGKNAEIINSKVVIDARDHEVRTIILADLLLTNTSVHIGNVRVLFINISFVNVHIHDMPGKSTTQHVQVTVVESTISCFSNADELFPDQGSVIRLSFQKVAINSCPIAIEATGIMITISKSLLNQTTFNINVESFLRIPDVIQFYQTEFRFQQSSAVGHILFLNLYNAYIDINGCKFQGVPLEIFSTKLYFEQHIFFTRVSNCTFSNSLKHGNGGAVFISSDVPKSKATFLSSIFVNNRALKSRSSLPTGNGGALSIEGYDMFMTVHSCVFIDNSAEEGGLDISASQTVVVLISNCSFLNHIGTNSKPFPAFVSLLGRVTGFSASFLVKNEIPEMQKFDINIINIDANFNDIDIMVLCPKWYQHSTEYKTISTINENNQSVSNLIYKCIPCPETFYTNSNQENRLTFSLNTGKISNTIKSMPCIKCPYGAMCSGNNVVARPNYWGYSHQGELQFQQCPPDYCCTGNEEAPCASHDFCAGHRTGTLCGACQDGFSVSMLSGKCTANYHCGKDHWFWPIAILATMVYAMWYTFKDDIFYLLSWFLKFFQSKWKKNEVIHLKDNTSNKGGSVNPSVQGNKQIADVDRYDEEEDNGYFGIVTYFIQMTSVMKIDIEFSEVTNTKSFSDHISQTIMTFLSIDLSNFSFKACPVLGLSTHGKQVYKLLFLFAIYLSWALVFTFTLVVFHIKYKKKNALRYESKFRVFQLRLVKGFVEIVKYTYSGICGVIFMSLVCIKLGTKHVWWHDGTNICLENWQIGMTKFALFYAIPFPFVLFWGMKRIREGVISSTKFGMICIFPPVALHTAFTERCYKNIRPTQTNKIPSHAAKQIISVLEGPYREDTKGISLYWEAMVSIRRLLITGMTLVSYASTRMIIIASSCAIFSVQHVYFSPFKSKASNHAETFSLVLLQIVAAINLLKACLTDSGVVPSGPSVPFFKGLEFCEKLLVVILISFIILLELKCKTRVK